jgi:hypothetical protein
LPGKYSQASTGAPSSVKLNPPGRIGRRVPREYTHMVYTRTVWI